MNREWAESGDRVGKVFAKSLCNLSKTFRSSRTQILFSKILSKPLAQLGGCAASWRRSLRPYGRKRGLCERLRRRKASSAYGRKKGTTFAFDRLRHYACESKLVPEPRTAATGSFLCYCGVIQHMQFPSHYQNISRTFSLVGALPPCPLLKPPRT